MSYSRICTAASMSVVLLVRQMGSVLIASRTTRAITHLLRVPEPIMIWSSHPCTRRLPGYARARRTTARQRSDGVGAGAASGAGATGRATGESGLAGATAPGRRRALTRHGNDGREPAAGQTPAPSLPRGVDAIREV